MKPDMKDWRDFGCVRIDSAVMYSSSTSRGRGGVPSKSGKFTWWPFSAFVLYISLSKYVYMGVDLLVTSVRLPEESSTNLEIYG